MRAFAAAVRSRVVATISAIRASVTGPWRPSEQSEQAVARPNVDFGDDGLEARVSAQRLQQHVAIRGPARLFGVEQARIHHLRDQRLIVGQRMKLSVAKEVGARIAHLTDHQPTRQHDGGRASRAHAPFLGFGFGLVQHGLVGVQDGVLQRLDRVLSHCRPFADQALLDRVRSDARRDLSCGMTSHAVADEQQDAARGDGKVRADAGVAQLARGEVGDHERIFVQWSHQADVGRAADRDSRRSPRLHRCCWLQARAQKMVFSFAKTKPRASAPATTRKGFLAMSRAVFFFAPLSPSRARASGMGWRDARRGDATVIAVARLETIAERLHVSLRPRNR